MPSSFIAVVYPARLEPIIRTSYLSGIASSRNYFFASPKNALRRIFSPNQG
jgi:hypothetical protein